MRKTQYKKKISAILVYGHVDILWTYQGAKIKMMILTWLCRFHKHGSIFSLEYCNFNGKSANKDQSRAQGLPGACGNLYNAELFFFNPWRLKGFFQFEIILNVLVGSLRFIWIPMLWVYGQWKYFNSFGAGIVFIRQNLTSTDVRFWPIKTVPALKGF